MRVLGGMRSASYGSRGGSVDQKHRRARLSTTPCRTGKVQDWDRLVAGVGEASGGEGSAESVWNTGRKTVTVVPAPGRLRNRTLPP